MHERGWPEGIEGNVGTIHDNARPEKMPLRDEVSPRRLVGLTETCLHEKIKGQS
jgi:hypothetical protein